MTRSLALELAPAVRVNGVAPGAVMWPSDGKAYDDQQAMLARTPLQRAGTPDDVAGAVLWLLRDAPLSPARSFAWTAAARCRCNSSGTRAAPACRDITVPWRSRPPRLELQRLALHRKRRPQVGHALAAERMPQIRRDVGDRSQHEGMLQLVRAESADGPHPRSPDRRRTRCPRPACDRSNAARRGGGHGGPPARAASR